MKFFFIFLIPIFSSCGYSDIDSVPSFNNLETTKEESIDLCYLLNTDSESLFKCLESLNIKDD